MQGKKVIAYLKNKLSPAKDVCCKVAVLFLDFMRSGVRRRACGTSYSGLARAHQTGGRLEAIKRSVV